MHGWRSRLAVLGVLAGLLAPVPAPAFDGNGCSRTWTNAGAAQTTCSFRFNGTPVTVFGQASGVTASRIRVWVSLGGNKEIALVECDDEGEKQGQLFYAQCSATFTPLVADVVLPTLPAGQGISLTCNIEVSGNRSGSAFCGSPDPCPTVGPGCLKLPGSAS